MSIFHRTGIVLEFRAGALGEEGSDARRSGPSAGLRPRGSPQRNDGGARLPVRAPTPGGVGRCATGTAGTACAPPPPSGESADGDRDVAVGVARAPPLGGVELVMSPRLALCEAGWRESSRGGFRRAGLARCKAGWTVSRWARIAQARPGPGPVIPLSGPGITQARPGPRRSGAGVRLRRSGSRGGRRARTQDVVAPARGRSGCRARHRGPDPDPRPGSSRPGPRDSDHCPPARTPPPRGAGGRNFAVRPPALNVRPG